MTEWNIQSRAHACAACGQPFADREVYHTLLFDEEPISGARTFAGPAGRSNTARRERPQRLHLLLAGRLRRAPAPGGSDSRENAESLLRKLIELNDPRYIPGGYILAVMLERKRLLKVKEQVMRDGHRVFIYEQPEDRRRVHHHRPGPAARPAGAVQRDVAALLEHGLNPPALNLSPTAAEAAPVEPRDLPAAAAEQKRQPNPKRRKPPDLSSCARTTDSCPPSPDTRILQNRLGYMFRDSGLAGLALTHPSVAHEQGAPVQPISGSNSSATPCCSLSLLASFTRNSPPSAKAR